MRKISHFPINQDVNTLKSKFIDWAEQYQYCCILDSNSYKEDKYTQFDFAIAVDAIEVFKPKTGNTFDDLYAFHQQKNDWLFGHFSYDLKNELEDLSSDNYDGLGWSNCGFFIPKWLFFIKGDTLECHYSADISESHIQGILNIVLAINSKKISYSKPKIKPRVSKEVYLETIDELLNHIQLGDIYEVNYCQEFFAEQASINPTEVYKNLAEISKAPFSALYKTDDKYLISASPERFIQKQGNTIISQPIKGTARRDKNKLVDDKLKEDLYNSQKERSENVMIVDLVRNDLSRTAQRGTVKVPELFGVYSFQQVHQLISTVKSELHPNTKFTDVIKYAYPMGSMTGAPKVSAMQLIEQYELTKRALFSGSVGYISPEGNFDFNVVIRSIQYNSANNYLSIMVGGAITINSKPNLEYDECMLKANALFKVLS